MRTQIYTNATVDYPEGLVWQNDNNFFLFTNLLGSYKISVSLAINALYNGVTYPFTYNYTSAVGSLTMRVSPLIRAYCPATISGAWKVEVYDQTDTLVETCNGSYSFKSVFGKSLQERHHGSERIITYADWAADMATIEVFKPQNWTGTITCGGVSFLVNDTEAQIRTLGPLTSDSIVKLVGQGGSVWAGEVWDDYQNTSWNIRLVQVCPPRDGIKLTYYDTDGCKRYAIGMVLGKTMAAKRDEYVTGGIVYDNVPQSLLTGYTGTLDVGFSDVEPEQYLEDIMLSPYVSTKKGAETVRLIPSTLSLVRDGDTKDIIIKFKIDA